MSGLREIRSHTGLRGVAALMVVAHHYDHPLTLALESGTWTGLIGGAGVFVDLFFVLSGFVLMASYRDRFADGVTFGTARDFWVRRFARVWPLHAATLAVMFVLATRGGATVGTGDLVRNLTLTQAWGATGAFVLNHPSWSISAEMFLYLLCPALIAAVLRPGGAILAGIAVAVLYAGLFGWGQGLDFDEATALARALPSFLLGMLLVGARGLTARWSEAALGAVQVATLAAVAAILHADIGQPLLVPLFAALIVTTEGDRGPVARALSRPWPHRLGEWSFAIYLLHIPMIQVAYLAVPQILPGIAGAPQAVANVALATLATLAAAPLCHRGFEMPARAWIVDCVLRGRHVTTV